MREGHTGCPTVRSGLLHLAEALGFHHDLEVVNSTVRAVIATLKSGERCSVEPELISKGIHLQGLGPRLWPLCLGTSFPHGLWDKL